MFTSVDINPGCFGSLASAVVAAATWKQYKQFCMESHFDNIAMHVSVVLTVKVKNYLSLYWSVSSQSILLIDGQIVT